MRPATATAVTAAPLGPAVGPSPLPPTPGALLPAYGAGMQNWPRYIAGMRRRGDFTRAAGVAVPVLGLSLAATGVLCYWRLGDRVDPLRPMSSQLDPDAWAVACNLGVFVHVIIAYVINLVRVPAGRMGEQGKRHRRARPATRAKP